MPDVLLVLARGSSLAHFTLIRDVRRLAAQSTCDTTIVRIRQKS